MRGRKWPTVRGEGRGIRFLRALLESAPPDCVIWPMFRDKSNGYGRLGINGEIPWAHRYMCELAHGPAPSADPRHPKSREACRHTGDSCVSLSSERARWRKPPDAGPRPHPY